MIDQLNKMFGNGIIKLQVGLCRGKPVALCFWLLASNLIVFFACSVEAENLIVGVTSTKKIKCDAAIVGAELLLIHYKKENVEIIPVSAGSGVAEQPVGMLSGFDGAKQRIDNARLTGKIDTCHVVFSFENYIVKEMKGGELIVTDYAAVVIEDVATGARVEQCSKGVVVDAAFLQIVEEISRQVNKVTLLREAETGIRFSKDKSGHPCTVGSVISLVYRLSGESIEPSDWHGHRDFGSRSRVDILADTAKQAAVILHERLLVSEH